MWNEDFGYYSSRASSDGDSIQSIQSTQSLIDLGFLRNYYAQEKKHFYETLRSGITSALDSCLSQHYQVEKQIKEVMFSLIQSVIKREKELLASLDELTAMNVRRLEKQLELCEEKILEISEKNRENIDYNCEGHLEGFNAINNKQINLKIDLSVFSVLKNLGQLSVNENVRFPKFTFGAVGNEGGQFCRPWGVCSDSSGRILVADRSNNRVQIFSEYGEFLTVIGKDGTEPGEFQCPSGVTVDGQNRIIVADKDNHRIQVFSYFGVFLFQFGERGSAIGQFEFPWDVAADNECNIAVSDSKNGRVQLFNKYGQFINSVHFKNHSRYSSIMDFPKGVAFRPDGSLLVTDFNNHKVVVFDQRLKLIKEIGEKGEKNGQFLRPQGIACDDNGRIAVADCKNHRIQVFDSHGRLESVFGFKGLELGEFDCPQGVCFHPNGSIVVVDFGNSRLQIF